MEQIMDQLTVFATEYGLKVIGAILIIVIGRMAAGFTRRLIKKLMHRAKADESLISFFASLGYILILVFTVIAALAKFGVQTASFVAILGAAGFAVGFALQGSLGNFAAGVMLLAFRPFKAGDLIEAGGVLGIVQEIRIFNTVLASLDNIKIIVPNGKIYGDVIKNLTGYDTRRVDLVFGIGYSSSIPKAMEIISNAIKADERILKEPEPQIAVSELADSSVNLVVRPWVHPDHYWDVYFDLTKKIKENFDAQGIEIPFPQRVVHMSQ